MEADPILQSQKSCFWQSWDWLGLKNKLFLQISPLNLLKKQKKPTSFTYKFKGKVAPKKLKLSHYQLTLTLMERQVKIH